MDQQAGDVLVRIPMDELHRLRVVEQYARELLATLEAHLSPDSADLEGSRHTAACHARRRAGLPGCSDDCRRVRTALFGDGAVDPNSF